MKTLKPDVLAKCMRIVETFEGGWLAGNFDGQILSWGPLQWNLGQNTLQPLLRRIYALDPTAMERHLGRAFCATLEDDNALEHFVRREVLRENGHAKLEWQRRFHALGQEPAATQAFGEAAQPYVDRAVRACLELGFRSERAFAVCLDTCVQNGNVRADHKRHYHQHLRRLLRAKGKPAGDPVYDLEEWEHLKALAYAVAECANPRWYHDVLARKLSLAVGQGIVHGRQWHFEQDFALRYWADRERRILATWYDEPNTPPAPGR